MSKVGKWLLTFVLAMGGLVLLLFVIAVLMPIKSDPVLLPEEYGAGASSVEPSYSGLQREFPPSNEPDDNPQTAEKVQLGQMLFFDPILSNNNDISCATCHHPDYGFADGLPQAIGAGGSGVAVERTGEVKLARNTPSLWNVIYQESLFWDGREASLEAQSLVPLTHVDEMASELNAMVAEVQAIPAYVEAFAHAFGGGEEAVAINEENISKALAAFQRTLSSQNSPFDEYAAGHVEALTPQQRRGLQLFRSGATRCFECHAAPTFGSNTFRVIGVPSEDPGRAGVVPDGTTGAFRVPSLRNVALTAPYMHNGSLATLEEVVDFYANGGGRVHGIESVDPFVVGFQLTEQERSDLVAFLIALTDESRLPPMPPSVPSGLPVVPRLENPARKLVIDHNRPLGSAKVDEPRQSITIRAERLQPLQWAVDRARPGDTVEIPYDIHYQTIALDTNDITLVGIPNEEGEWPIMDGKGEMSEAIIASGNNFSVSQLHIRNYTDNGILVEGVQKVHIHDIVTENTGTYGVYPVKSTDVLIERVKASGVNDAAIYAGQSENVVIRDSEAFGSVIGIELENTLNGEVYNNHAHDNSVGILVVLLPQLTSKVSKNTKVYDNLLENNNLENFADPDMTAAFVPPGLGILVAASDENEIYNNTIRNHKTSGIALFNLSLIYEEGEIDIGLNPENNNFYDNKYGNNGYAPAELAANMGIPTGDILWDGSGFGNTFDETQANAGFPPTLPTSNWPLALQKAYWQGLNVLIGVME